MKVPTTSTVRFVTGDVLDPADLNRVIAEASDALRDVAQKRYQHSVLVLPFVASVSSGYTEGTAEEVRTYRFRCPETCVIERAYLHGNLTSSAAVTVSLTDTSAALPTGATSPYLSTGAAVASASDDTEDINVDRVLLVAGTEYLFKVASTGTFTLERFDVVLHLLVDNFVAAPSFSPSPLTDADARNATALADSLFTLESKADQLNDDNNALAPMLFVAHGFTSSTDADLLTFPIPRFDSARAGSRIARIYLFAVMTSTAGHTIKAAVFDEAGSTTSAAVTADVTGKTQESADSGDEDLSLVAATAGITVDTTKDYKLTLENTHATNCLKAYALVWLRR